MKKNILTLILPLFLLCSFTPFERKASQSYNGRAYDSTQMLDFSSSTEEEINTCYGDIESKSSSKLMSYLYTVTSNDNYFISYDNAKKWYKITDRNWSLSREIQPETYKFSEDIGNNYYNDLLYFEDNSTQTKQINIDVNSFDNNDIISEIDWENKLKPKKAGENTIQIDREHVWAKNHGFSLTDSDIEKGAGTDLHHLLAADHNSNNNHSDLYYNTVVNHSEDNKIYCLYADGTKSLSGYKGNDKNGVKAFEPTDQYKGDIARALLYMGTRYSNKLETNTKAEPYLLLTDDLSLKDDNDKCHGVHQNLSTFLEWNELDPVDSYEKKRNDLIYKNVQKNRNPYIDHPEWARRVYDPTWAAEYDFSSFSSEYYLHLGTDTELCITKPTVTDSTLTAKIEDESVLSLSEDLIKVHPLKKGKTKITYTLTKKNGTSTDYTTSVSINDKIVIPSMTESEFVLDNKKGENYQIDLTGITGLFENEKIRLTSSDEGVATVSQEGLINGVKEGTCSIYVDSVINSQVTRLKTIKVNITVDKTNMYLIIIIVASVLLIIFFILLFLGINIANKKNKSTNYTSKEYSKKQKSKKQRKRKNNSSFKKR